MVWLISSILTVPFSQQQKGTYKNPLKLQNIHAQRGKERGRVICLPCGVAQCAHSSQWFSDSTQYYVSPLQSVICAIVAALYYWCGFITDKLLIISWFSTTQVLWWHLIYSLSVTWVISKSKKKKHKSTLSHRSAKLIWKWKYCTNCLLLLKWPQMCVHSLFSMEWGSSRNCSNSDKHIHHYLVAYSISSTLALCQTWEQFLIPYSSATSPVINHFPSITC